MNVAIIIGISDYKNIEKLESSLIESKIFYELVEHSNNYQEVLLLNSNSSSNRNSLFNELEVFVNTILEKNKIIEELFLYYTGHGGLIDDKFIIKTSDYEQDENNQKGYITDSEVNEILRKLKPKIFIKIIDACFSGYKMIKDGEKFSKKNVNHFEELLFISSSTGNQKSYIKNTISDFTKEIFNLILEADIEKEISYLKMMDYLTKKFESNKMQTPFYIFQGNMKKNFLYITKELKEIIKKEKIFLEKNESMEKKQNTVRIAYINKFLGVNYSFTNSLIEEVLNNNCDYIIVSGIKNSYKNEFSEIKNNLSDNLLKKYPKLKSVLGFVCGEFDTDDNKVKDLLDYLKKELITNEKISEFIEREDHKLFQFSCDNIAEFYKFQEEIMKNNQYSSAKKLYATHIITIQNISFGIVLLNTCWFPKILRENRKNIIPLDILKQGYKNIKDCQIKIIITYESLNSLSDFNKFEIKSYIHKYFNALFCGNSNDKNLILNDEGIIVLNPRSVETEKIIYYLDFFPNEYLCKVYTSKIENNLNKIIDCKTIQIPHGKEKAKIIKFHEKMKKELDNEYENCNDYFLSGNSRENKDHFIKLFTDPVLSEKSKVETQYTIKNRNKRIEFSEIINSNENFVIYGSSKSGKTSLLKMLQINLLNNYLDNKIIPIFIDLRDRIENLDVEEIIKRNFSLNKSDYNKLINNYRFRILLDNFEIQSYSKIVPKVENILKNNPDINFCICSNNEYLGYEEKEVFPSFKKLYIHELGDREIKKLIEKWPNLSSKKKKLHLKNLIKFLNNSIFLKITGQYQFFY